MLSSPEAKRRQKNAFYSKLPETLVPYLTVYLEIVRPAILRSKIHTALWVSAKGGALSYVGLGKSFARISSRLGVRISPHDARDAAVTTWAIARPSQIAVARDLLYHSRLDTTNLYNRTKGIEASRAYRQVLAEIRKDARNRGHRRRA